MRLAVVAGGRPRTVEIQRAQGRLAVVVDGRARALSVAPAGRFWSLLVGQKSYEVSVVDHRRGEFTVYVNGRAVPVAVDGRAVRLKPDTPYAGGGSVGVSGFSRTAVEGSRTDKVVAPMPGRIVKVLVKPGDVVEARQGLIVVEAMKMENELRAPRAATVKDVKVAEGASVEAQALLITLE